MFLFGGKVKIICQLKTGAKEEEEEEKEKQDGKFKTENRTACRFGKGISSFGKSRNLDFYKIT